VQQQWDARTKEEEEQDGSGEMSKSLDPLYKAKVTLDLGRRIHAVEK
jgi:hypothetical protein